MIMVRSIRAQMAGRLTVIVVISQASGDFNLKTAIGIQTSTAKAQRRQEKQRFESKLR